MRELIKRTLNSLAKPFGVRLAGSEWGPRGFASCFARAKSIGFEPATVIDVGASDGCWTKECREIFPLAHYALFDPLPENVAALKALSARHPAIAFWSGAVGAREERLQINSHGDQTSFYASGDFPGAPLDVEVRPLDSFIESMNIEGPALLKADVQGYELEVLRGAARCLQMTDILMMEVSFRRVYDGSPLAHDVIAELGEQGFRIYDICSYVQRPRDKELTHADIVFVRNGSPLFQHEGWK